jgi:hypothetical protein
LKTKEKRKLGNAAGGTGHSALHIESKELTAGT